MLNVYYSESAISTLKGFIRAYEEAFFELYRDSGLVTKEVIIENFRFLDENGGLFSFQC